MKILYVGGGYVGACSAAIAADSGHDVVVYDINKELIAKMSTYDRDTIESCLFERGLGDAIVRNRLRIKFTDDLNSIKDFIDNIKAIFLCLPTPEKDGTGETNLSFYESAVKDLAKILVNRNGGCQCQYVLLINKSTVPILMVNNTKKLLEECGVKNFGVGSNPEFLVEGKALEGSVKPERVVVGAWTEQDFDIFRDVYNRFCDSPNVVYIEVNPLEAAAGKLLANYILFNRIANCFGVVGRVCEKIDNMHFENIRKILVTDTRIGDWGFYNSLFAGGSCFIKDARSLAYQLQQSQANVDLILDTLGANTGQLDNFLQRAKTEFNFDWNQKTVGLLGLAFKRDTNDIRNSASLKITEFLLENGAKQIKAYDSLAGQNYLKYFSNHAQKEKISLVDSEKAAFTGCDIVIISTDWPQFRELIDDIKTHLPKGSIIMDGRRLLQHKYKELAESGYNVIAVGEATVRAKSM